MSNSLKFTVPISLWLSFVLSRESIVVYFVFLNYFNDLLLLPFRKLASLGKCVWVWGLWLILLPVLIFLQWGPYQWTSCRACVISAFPFSIPFLFGVDNLEIMILETGFARFAWYVETCPYICARLVLLGWPPARLHEGKGVRKVCLSKIPSGRIYSEVWESQCQYRIQR